MNLTRLLVLAVLLILTTVLAMAQDGTDIAQARPIYFGQTIDDFLDSGATRFHVYSIPLARGQTISAAMTVRQDAPTAALGLTLLPPGTRSVANCSYFCSGSGVSENDQGSGVRARSIKFTAAVEGTYYIMAGTNSRGVNYRLQATTEGSPVGAPNPTSAGCLNGQVDSITYSLQLVHAGLPDEVTIGGTRLCATCSVKPPAYAQLVSKMETAMGLNVGVSACYDSAGNVFQLKLLRP